MTTLLETTSDKYLRRLSKAINAHRYGQPMHVTLAGCNETRRIRSARFAGRMLQVRTIGSDMWFPVYSAEQITGVCASRVVQSKPTLAHKIRQQITAGVCGQ